MFQQADSIEVYTPHDMLQQTASIEVYTPHDMLQQAVSIEVYTPHDMLQEAASIEAYTPHDMLQLKFQLKRLQQEQTASTSNFIRSGLKKSSLLHAFHLCRLQENELVEQKSS